MAALYPASLFLLFDKLGFFLGVELVRVHPKELAARYSGHLLKIGIRENYVPAIIRDEYPFVQALKNALNLLEPIWLLDFHGIPFASASKSGVILNHNHPSHKKPVRHLRNWIRQVAPKLQTFAN
jgi:hypothetical protein